MENLIYRNGIAIGMDCGRYIAWFSSAFENDAEDSKRFDIPVVQNPPSDQLEDTSAS